MVFVLVVIIAIFRHAYVVDLANIFLQFNLRQYNSGYEFSVESVSKKI